MLCWASQVALVVKNLPASSGDTRDANFSPWQSTLVFLPGKFHGQRSLAGYSPWGSEETGMTEHTQNVVLVSAAQQSESAIRIHTSLPLEPPYRGQFSSV